MDSEQRRGRLMADASRIDAAALAKTLRDEGFGHVFEWRDGAHAFYPDHTHAMDTAHIVLEGEMTLTCGGETRTFAAGERPPDVPAGAIHSARMGPRGCRYLIGER